MFSGLVRNFAKVRSYDGGVLSLESHLNVAIGDSVAVNGACLTVISSRQGSFELELSDNTQKSVAIENLKGLVHVEPALRLSDGLHGHIVQGHIDYIGVITSISHGKDQIVFNIEVDSQAMMSIIDKGSICIDGISLTINRVLDNAFELVIIPHTLERTLFKTYKVGRRVNVETDVIVRSVVSVVRKIVAKNDHLDIKARNIATTAQDIYDEIALSY